MEQTIRLRLQAMAEPAYRDFSAALVPGCENMLGVRIPKLRALAKELSRGDWQAALEGSDESFEECLLRGFVVAGAKLTDEARMELVRDFVPRIENWSVCDCFCVSLHCMKQRPAVWWPLLTDYAQSEAEFPIRFAVVCMLGHYLDTEFLPQVLACLASLEHPGFYVHMAVAWALATAYIRDAAGVTAILQAGRLDPETHRLCIQKLIDSRRVSDADKTMLRTLRRK